MEYTLLSREEIDKLVFTEKAGMVNLYTCSNCRQSVMYLYIDGGITPHSIECIHCGSEAFSQITAIRQPTLVWYRPNNIEELKALAEVAYKVGKYENKKMKITILNNYIIHYNQGGLFARSIR